MKATESLTNQQEKHKGGPILYRANDEDRSGCGATRAISLGDLWYGLDEVTFAIIGCLDMVEEMQETNQNASLIAPLLMLRLALKFGMDRLWELSPCADKRNRDIHADKTPDGGKTISYGIPDRKGGAA